MTKTKDIQLTERQEQVASLLSRHHGIKEIALDLGLATSTVSDHITALKRIFDTTSHAGIVSGYLQSFAGIEPHDGPEKVARHLFRIPERAVSPPEQLANDPGQLGFGDSLNFSRFEWPIRTEPQIVPRWLDGEHALAARLAVILAGMFVLVATVV
ncbi:MAG: LuxR C-terminal-related transcriptional regulator, partial [Alteraurantiacibacter sp.]